MTAAQALRYERRQAVAQMRRERRLEAAKGAVLIALMLILFTIAGTMEYHDAQSQSDFWADQGVTIGGW